MIENLGVALRTQNELRHSDILARRDARHLPFELLIEIIHNHPMHRIVHVTFKHTCNFTSKLMPIFIHHRLVHILRQIVVDLF